MNKFTITFLSLLSASAAITGNAAVTSYAVYKQHQFNQTTAAPSVEAGFVKYRLHTLVNVSDGDTIAMPTYTIPSGTFAGSQGMFPLGTSNDWIRNLDATSKIGLDDLAGNGDYGMSIDGFSPTLTVNPENYPTNASVTGGTWGGGHLKINAALDYNFTFDGPTAGNFTDGVDLIQLLLRPQGVGSIFFYESSTLTNLFTIPAGSLVEGLSYDVELLIVDVTERDTTTIPGALGYSGFATQTFLQADAIPEPQTNALLGAALLIAVVCAVRKKRKASSQC